MYKSSYTYMYVGICSTLIYIIILLVANEDLCHNCKRLELETSRSQVILSTFHRFQLLKLLRVRDPRGSLLQEQTNFRLLSDSRVNEQRIYTAYLQEFPQNNFTGEGALLPEKGTIDLKGCSTCSQ